MYSHMGMDRVDISNHNFNDINVNETDTFYILKGLRCSEGVEQISLF